VPKKLIDLFVTKSNHRSIGAEALNLVFAKKGDTIEDILEPVDNFPEAIRADMLDILHRRPYQISVANMSKLYVLKKFLG
jgi:hypothetical protein